MFDLLHKTVAAALVAAGLSAAAPQAEAATVPFVIDRSASSVTLEKKGSLCIISNCGVTASLASGLVQGATHEIGTGDRVSFDFLRFDNRGTGKATYDITAVLAFASPELQVVGNGFGTALTFVGTITGGFLKWTDMPQELTIGGSTFRFDFEDGVCILCGSEKTITASIEGVNVVPLPAGGLLLIGGLGALALLRRRPSLAA
ncbi:VPLPA-CTERM sorting domain-containing protein [Cereibacter sediminicola]|uniref:VPLPA-CTERM sorting domain-containing protein n=1 Tax=Cereibacter sediminicola TaxID=2584941 RepID=UPI001FECCABC|nr:VPLPA-CTERM sorting domain-containing protein [Cereibacter sediminicola]